MTATRSKRPDTTAFLWEFRPYFRQVLGQLVLGSLAGIVMNTAVVLPAILLGSAIDAALAFERGEVGGAIVAQAAVVFVGGTLLTEVPRALKRWWLQTANARMRSNVRADALRGVLAWPMERLHRTAVGDTMARLIGDVEVLGIGIRELTIETWDTILFSISFVVAMLAYDRGLTLLALLPVPAAIVLAHASGRWVRQRTTTAREANGELITALQEQLAGMRVLRLFGRGDAAIGRVAELSRRQADANLATVRLQGGLRPVYSSLMTAGVVLIVWQGGEQVLGGAMSLGAFVAYLGLYTRFVNRAFRIPQLVNTVQAAAAAYDRLRPLLARPLPLAVEPRWASFDAGRVAGEGMLERRTTPRPAGPVCASLENVVFRYPGAARPALDGVWLQAEAGSMVAVTGPVGSGKSALARALLGGFPLEAGRVCFDGVEIAGMDAVERAQRVGYLPQDPYLFSGTVRDNIQLGDTVEKDTALEEAVTQAALTQDLATMPYGLETEIGELGIRVSGGQRQRIALARALAGSPGLLVLDDLFSAVDVDTEAAIIAGLRAAFGPTAAPGGRATIVLCSHRLAAFPLADQIVVLDEGRIVEQGSHQELLAAGSLYARIYYAQQRVERAPSSAAMGSSEEKR